MKYHGSCHCGRIAFDVEGEIESALACNCSMCQRKGSLLWFVPRDALKLATPPDASRVYEFNRHVIKHHFCPTCGIHPLAEANHPRTGKPTAAINVRCLEGIDLESLKIKKFNGRTL